MPICAVPSRLTSVCLKIDEGTPEETRPVFMFRFITSAERATPRELIAKARAAKTDEEAAPILCEAIRFGLVDWRNMGRDFAPPPKDAPDPLREFLTDSELWELAGSFLAGVTIGEHDLKNSRPPSHADTAKSAASAGAGSAATPQPPANP